MSAVDPHVQIDTNSQIVQAFIDVDQSRNSPQADQAVIASYNGRKWIQIQTNEKGEQIAVAVSDKSKASSFAEVTKFVAEFVKNNSIKGLWSQEENQAVIELLSRFKNLTKDFKAKNSFISKFLNFFSSYKDKQIKNAEKIIKSSPKSPSQIFKKELMALKASSSSFNQFIGAMEKSDFFKEYENYLEAFMLLPQGLSRPILNDPPPIIVENFQKFHPELYEGMSDDTKRILNSILELCTPTKSDVGRLNFKPGRIQTPPINQSIPSPLPSSTSLDILDDNLKRCQNGSLPREAQFLSIISEKSPELIEKYKSFLQQGKGIDHPDVLKYFTDSVDPTIVKTIVNFFKALEVDRRSEPLRKGSIPQTAREAPGAAPPKSAVPPQSKVTPTAARPLREHVQSASKKEVSKPADNKPLDAHSAIVKNIQTLNEAEKAVFSKFIKTPSFEGYKNFLDSGKNVYSKEFNDLMNQIAGQEISKEVLKSVLIKVAPEENKKVEFIVKSDAILKSRLSKHEFNMQEANILSGIPDEKLNKLLKKYGEFMESGYEIERRNEPLRGKALGRIQIFFQQQPELFRELGLTPENQGILLNLLKNITPPFQELNNIYVEAMIKK